MALTVTISGVNQTNNVDEKSIRITQLADSFTFTAELMVYDEDSDISITAGSHLVADQVLINDGVTIFFGGYVANQDITVVEGGARELHLQCQGYGILVGEAYLEYEEYTATSDADIIDDVFSNYLATLDSTTHVATIDGSMDILFEEMTLAEVMDAICERTGGRWYVDNEGNVHYFADEGDDAGFDLSDEPDDITSFAYFDRPQKKENAAQIVNKVRVIGADGFAVVRNDAGSQASYGIRAAIITDASLTTTAEMEERGDAILAQHADPKVTFVVRTYHDGAVAGNEIDFKCDELDYNSISNGDDPLVIRELHIYWDCGDPVYEMTLGEAELLAMSRASYTTGEIRRVVIDTPLPLAARGWSHNLGFSATDDDTVAWEAGTIYLAGGVGSFSIDAGNTGNMGVPSIHYIYFDADVSLTALQTSQSAVNTVGQNKILVAVAAPTSEAGKLAMFQVFGGPGYGVIIMADNILADSVDTNELVANSVTTAILDTYAVTAVKIAAGAVVASKLSIGELEFDAVDGLLMLGPPWNIVESGGSYYIQGTKGSRATIAGAVHFEQGRWLGSQGIVVEEGRTNYCTNPRMYDSDADDNAEDWSYTDTFGSGGDATLDIVTHPRTERGWLQNMAYTAAAGDVDDEGFLFHRTAAASFAAGDDCIYSVDIRGETDGCQLEIRLIAESAANANLGSQSENITPTQAITRHEVVYETLPANTDHVRVTVHVTGVDNGDSFDVSFGAVNVEKVAYSTSFIAGNLGQGYAWSGTADDSTSTRTRTDVTHDADPWLPILSSDAGSFMIWFQMPTDSGSLNDNWARIFEYGNYSTGPVTADWFTLYFDADGNAIQHGIHRLSDTSEQNSGGAAVSYSAGDWLCALVAWDSDELVIYWQGAELDTIDSPHQFADYDFSTFNLLHAGAADICNATLGFFCTWARKVTAEEAAKLYQLGVPPVDLGAMDKPGIYIYDGQFKIISNLTGNRIEITPDEIAGYDGSGTKQFYLRSEDGKALAGAGAIYLDETGTNIIVSTSEADTRAYKFVLTEDGTVLSGLYAYAPDAWTNTLNLRAKSIASRSTTINILSDSPATYPAYISIKAGSSANYAQILLTADSDAAVKERIDFYADLFNFGIAAVPAAVVSCDGYVPLYFNGTLRKVFYGTFS